MKPIFLKVANSPETSIDIRHEIAPYFKNPWHFHPELELNLILKSSGTKFIGDSISAFYAGELTLTGPELPHYWHNDPIYYQEERGLNAEAIIVRFPENFLSRGFLELPEMHHVRCLINLSRRGLQITGDLRDYTSAKMKDMLAMNGADRLITLLQILNRIAGSSQHRCLSSIGFTGEQHPSDTEKVNDVYTYVLGRFGSPITLSAVAAVANMNPTAFCRYFKVKTGKTFTRFLHEIRIGYACKLLIEGRLNVSEICYESGFQNQSYFIKQFKRICGETPLQYRSRHSTSF